MQVDTCSQAKMEAFQANRGFIFVLACLLIWQAPAVRAYAATAHNSYHEISSSNGITAINFDVSYGAQTSFLEHIYRFYEAGQQSRDFCYDNYFGVRIAGNNQWLSTLAIETAGYIPGTGIIKIERQFHELKLNTYLFVPYGLTIPGQVMLLELRNDAAFTVGPISVFSLHNFHLGYGSPHPDAQDEWIFWDSENKVFGENRMNGPGMLYMPLDEPDFHGCSPDNPYALLTSGDNLKNNDNSSGQTHDAVAGFQWQLGKLKPGESRLVGVAIAYDDYQNHDYMLSGLKDYIDGRSALILFEDEKAEWAQWLTPAPENLSASQQKLYLQSQIMLRMGQVRQAGSGFGQILASLPPGNWNIAWVRDMVYAIVALVHSGHHEEAWNALRFMLEADSGYYQSYVGMPYQISVTRYYGNGSEESDSNAHGPNIEFDGFGLFLWALETYAQASKDMSWQTYWPLISSMIADVLVGLVDAETGLIAADSSIWEVHWEGMQKRYLYTSLAAVKGLCAASNLASIMGDDTSSMRYQHAAQAISKAIRDGATDAEGFIVQSYEEFVANSGYHDAAVVEAINWGVVHPDSQTAQAIIDILQEELAIDDGPGFFRNDDGGWYDSQEWVFIDLRVALAMHYLGRTASSQALLDWIEDQSSHNYYQIAELYDAVSADYAGETPMVGFGAGAYILASQALAEQTNFSASCGLWAFDGSSDADSDIDVSMDDGGPLGQDDGGPSGKQQADSDYMGDSHGSGDSKNNGSTAASSGQGCGCHSSAQAAYQVLGWLCLLLAFYGLRLVNEKR